MKVWTVSAVVALVAGVVIYNAAHSGFSKTDLDQMKAAIRTEFEKKSGVTVKEVVMLRESDKKAVGFVKLNFGNLPEITKNCSASMDDSDRDYVWRCN